MSRKKLSVASSGNGAAVRRKSGAASSSSYVSAVVGKKRGTQSTKKKKRGIKRMHDFDSSSSDGSDSYSSDDEESESESESDSIESSSSTSSESSETEASVRQTNHTNATDEDVSTDVKVDEETIDAIMVRVNELLKPFPSDHLYHKMHEHLKKQYENIKNNTIKLVFCAKRGEGKSETTNFCAMSQPKLKSEGFPELYGKVPLESALRGTSVTSIPAWLEYSEDQPECLVKLSNGQEIDIYDLADAFWKKSDEARISKIARASPFIKTALVFRYANTHTKMLVTQMVDSGINISSSPASAASSSSAAASSSSSSSHAAASSVQILEMTLKWKWEFGSRFRTGDTLGWEDAATNDLNAPLMKKAEVFASMTARAVSNDELKSLFQHGAFSKNSETQQRPTSLLSFYRTSQTDGDANLKVPPTGSFPAIDAPLDAQQLYLRALAQTLQDPAVATTTRDWQERCEMFQSLQRNAVLCGFDREDPENTFRLIQQALKRVNEKFMQQKLMDFIKETSSVVFGVNRRLHKVPGKSSNLYRTAELRKRSAQKPSYEKEIKKRLSETVFDDDFDPHDFGGFPMPDSQAARDFQARKYAVFAAGNMFASGNGSTSSSSLVSSHASSFTDQEVLYRVNQLRTLLMEFLVKIQLDYCILSLQALVNRVEENKKQSQEDEDAMDVDEEAVEPLSPKPTPAKSRKSRGTNSTPKKKKVKMEQGNEGAASSIASAAAAALAPSSPLAASPSQRQASGDSAIDSPQSVMSVMLNSSEIQKPIADLFEALRSSIRQSDLYDILTNAVIMAQDEVIPEFEMGMKGVGPNGEDLNPNEREAQYKPSLSERAIQIAYKCIHEKYEAEWISQFENLAVTTWSRLKRNFLALESDTTNLQVGTQEQSDGKQLCQDLKKLSNQHLERTNQNQQLAELSRGGTVSDAIRVNGLPRAPALYNSLEKLVRDRQTPPTEAEVANAESNEFHIKCPSWMVKAKKEGNGQGIKVSLLTSEPISIRASFSQSTSDRIEMYCKSISENVHFGTEHKGNTDRKNRMLFPVYTPLCLTCEVDAQAFVRGSDYNGMKHLLFVSVERGQQQQWLEKALSEHANEASNIISVSIASADPTIHLDVLRSLLTSFGFQYAWRRTMNFKGMVELQPIRFSTFRCETSFAMISMQQVMKDLFNHTVIRFAKGFSSALMSRARRLILRSDDISEDKQEQLSTIMDQLMLSVANSDSSKPSSSAASSSSPVSASAASLSSASQSQVFDGAATITEIELRDLASAIRAVNSKADFAFSPLLGLLQPYFLCGMMTAFPNKFLVHSYLPIYPDLHQVHASSTRMHSLVLEHLPALSHIPFNNPKDAKSAADKYQLAQTMLPPTSSRQQLQEKKVEFEMVALRAEQRCKERIHGKNSKLCVPHILCASFGLDLIKYSTKPKKPASGKGKTPNAAATSAAASAAAAASSHASPSLARQTTRNASNTKVKKEK